MEFDYQYLQCKLPFLLAFMRLGEIIANALARYFSKILQLFTLLYERGVWKMREKRLKKFKKLRHRKMRRIFLFTFVVPVSLGLLGYLIAAVIILPAM